jgi:hypothetical protein
MRLIEPDFLLGMEKEKGKRKKIKEQKHEIRYRLALMLPHG